MEEYSDIMSGGLVDHKGDKEDSEEPELTEEWRRMCEGEGCSNTLSIETPSTIRYQEEEDLIVIRLVENGWAEEVIGGHQYFYCPECAEERRGVEESNEDSPTTEDTVDVHGEPIPQSNIYPKLSSDKLYIVNPDYLIVHEGDCYGFNKWEPDIVIDGLADRKRVGDKGEWYDEHFNDTVKVYDTAREELLIRRCLGSCLPIMPPPTIDEAIIMARDRKKVIDREGRAGSIIGVHGRSEDRHILFFVKFNKEQYEHSDFYPGIVKAWYRTLVERPV